MPSFFANHVSDLSLADDVESRMEKALKSFTALCTRMVAMTDGSIKTAASEIADYINPSSFYES